MRAVPRLCELYPGICLTTEEKARKNLSQGSRRGGKKKPHTHKQQQKTNKSKIINVKKRKPGTHVWRVPLNIQIQQETPNLQNRHQIRPVLLPSQKQQTPPF